MAKNRFINTKFWSDSFISELNPLDRYLFLYLLTNEHTNICGIYELPLKIMANETGIERDMLEKMFKRLESKIWHIDGWVYIKNFEKHQNTRSSDVKTGIENAKNLVPKEILNKIRELETIPRQSRTIPRLSDLPNLTKPNLTKPNLTKPNSETSSTDISLLIKTFEGINPASKKFYGNSTQRDSCQSLIDTYTLKRVITVIEKTLPKTNGMEFFPTINTPLQLFEKWSSLESAIKKYQSKNNKEQSSKGKAYW